jgi:hypothetical protein
MRPAIVSVLVLAACANVPVVAPVDVDRDQVGTPLGAACANLRTLACPEGSPTELGETCFEHLTKLSATAAIPTACVTGAKTQDALRACGSDAQVRFRCSN